MASLDDVNALVPCEDDGVDSVITGRAIYEGTLDFAEGQKLADSLANSY